MRLKLKSSIRCGGKQYRPTTVNEATKEVGVIDTVALGISDSECNVLIKRGVAVLANAVEAPAKAAANAPEVTNLGLGQSDEATLTGAVNEEGKTVDLIDMKKDELLAIARGMELEVNDKMTKAAIIELIQSQPSVIDVTESSE